MYNNDLLKQTYGVTIHNSVKGSTVLVSDSEGFGGPPGLIWRGEWESDREYAYSDLVLHNGNLWFCKEHGVVGEPHSNSTQWDKFLPSIPPGVIVDAIQEARNYAEAAQGYHDALADLADQVRNFDLNLNDPQPEDVLEYDGVAWVNKPGRMLVDGGNF